MSDFEVFRDQCGRLTTRDAFEQMLELANLAGWTPDKGCRYVDLTHSGLVKQLTGGKFPSAVADVEILTIDGSLKPHFHERSDSIVTVWGSGAEQYLNGSWVPIDDGKTVLIRRGTPHGFRITGEPVQAIVCSFPRIAEDDTHDV